MSKTSNFNLILLLGLLSTISPFSIDMYLPGFPAIAESLDTSIAKVQLSLTSYLVGIAVGQLFYGPLLDRYGRKRPLYVGLSIYILSSFACAGASTVDALIYLRFVQAIGGCAGMVAAQALVRDLFPVNKIAQAFAYLTLVIAVSPMIAPTVGGYLSAHLDWHYLFIVLGAIGTLILVFTKLYLPKGMPADRSISLKPKQVARKYLLVLKNKQFLTFILVGGIAGAAPFAYIAGSSDVFINQFGLSETIYGWIFAFLAVAMIGSTQLNHILLKKYSNQQIIQVALSYQVILGLFLVLGIYFDWFSVGVFIVMLFVFLTGHGLSVPNSAALSLAPFSQNAGSASAMMGFMRMAIGGLVTALVSVFHDGTAMPMVVLMAICILGGLLVLSLYHRKRLLLMARKSKNGLKMVYR